MRLAMKAKKIEVNNEDFDLKQMDFNHYMQTLK